MTFIVPIRGRAVTRTHPAPSDTLLSQAVQTDARSDRGRHLDLDDLRLLHHRTSAFSRRRPAASRPSPPSCSSRARTAGTVRPVSCAYRSSSASISASLTADVLAPRDLVQHHRRRHRFGGRLALAFAERGPVDVGLARIDRADPSAGGRSPRRADRLRDRPATPGTGKGTRAASFFSTSFRDLPLGRLASPRPRGPARTRVAQRLERVELAQVLRELVVERRDDALADVVQRHRVVDLGAGQFRHGVVVRDSAAGTTWCRRRHAP